VVLAVLVPFTLTLASYWTSASSDISFADRERDGVVLLRPLARLIAATADVQTDAVAGNPVDASQLKLAIKVMDVADARAGGPLNTSPRWTDLRGRLNQLITSSPQGASAYQQFGTVVDLEVALTSVIGDASNLILDPELDSYYLMDTSLLRVPGMIVQAGRVADLVTLDERKPAADTTDLTAAVASSNVQQAVTAIDAGLRKSFASTVSRTLGPGLLSQLDRLRDGVSQLAPPSTEVGQPSKPQKANALQSARIQVRDAALDVEDAALNQLDLLLADRSAASSRSRLLVALATAAGLAVIIAVAWMIAPHRRRPVDEPLPELAPDHTADAAGTAADRNGSANGRDGSANGRDPDGHQDQDLLEARDLLHARRLVRMGRAVSAPRERS
jgi:hypothetical protein